MKGPLYCIKIVNNLKLAIMSKKQQGKKNKKAPAMNLKEKREAKATKRKEKNEVGKL